MKKRIVLFFLVLGLMSCKKKPVQPTLPEIDFDSSNYFTPTDISNYKTSVACDETPYWEGQRIRLQGFVFSGNISTKEKKFFLYDNIRVFESTNRAIEVYYESKDSAIISNALLDSVNKDKHCLLKVSCITKSDIIIGCSTFIVFTIKNPADLEFK